MRRFFADVFRVGLLLLAAGSILYLMDPANVVVFQALLIGLFVVGGTHLTRRVLFPRLDLQSIAKRAVEDNNTPAAIIFAAVVAFLIAVMFLSMGVLK